jgi:large subunit ribosomal protein L13
VNLDQRKWHVIDADGAVLGRLAAQVADVLRGKNKPVYTPHLDAGDFVVVINAEKVRVTGKKETDKKFMSYSGWKGGEKYTTVAQVRAKQPERLIEHAVKGMIPEEPARRAIAHQAESVQRSEARSRRADARRARRRQIIFHHGQNNQHTC